MIREFRVAPPTKRKEYRVGELVGAQGNQRLLAKGTRNGQIAWSLVCTGCGTNPGMIIEDQLATYKCPSSICRGTSRIEGDDRRYKDYAPRADVFTPVRQSELSKLRLEEEQQQKANEERIAREKAAREKAAQEAVRKESEAR